MSKSFVYDRFDCTNGGSQHCYGCYGMDPCSDGDYVKAKDAINHEAVLQAQISTLEVQLKDAKTRTVEYDKLLDWGLSVFGVQGWDGDPWAIDARKLLGRKEPNC